MTAGLIHYWPLDETVGAVAVDVVGGWNSPVIGDPGDLTIAAGWLGNGRDLGAVSPAAAIELWDGLADPDYVFERWSFGLAFKAPLAYVGGTDLYYSESTTTWLWVYLEAGGTGITAMVGDGLNFHTLTWTLPAGDFFDDIFHLVHVTHSQGTLRLFVDGEERATEAATYSFRPKSGGDTAPTLGWDFAGTLDEVQIWERAIALSEHVDMWNGGAGVGALTHAESVQRAIPTELEGLLLTPRYYCDIEDGVLPPLRVRMTSWQATIQKDRASYLQAAIPNIGKWIDAIQERVDPEFVIRRGNVKPDGTLTEEFEIARAPLTLTTNTGWLRDTGTFVGYAYLDPPVNPIQRVLKNARSLSSTDATLRLRATLDYLIRPGDEAIVNEATSFEVAYINYYVTGNDEYMDIGSRAL